MTQPAYKSMKTERCAECGKQHVFANGAPVCGHTITSEGKRICRRCWGKLYVRQKHSGTAQHITI